MLDRMDARRIRGSRYEHAARSRDDGDHESNGSERDRVRHVLPGVGHARSERWQP
jgi:hypothetical protein